MVYFGERRFKNARPGVSSREKSRIVVPTLLLLVLVLTVLVQRWQPEHQESSIPIRTHSENRADLERGFAASSVPDRSIPSEEGLERPNPLPPYDPNVAASTFTPDESLLAEVRDEEIISPGATEEAALIYLFHRFRSGPPQPLVQISYQWRDLPEIKGVLRGTRHLKYFKLIEEPFPRDLPSNRSGVRRYWEVFAQDRDGHLAKLDFIEKPTILSAGTEVEAEVDFFRLHLYQTFDRGAGIVPEWVADDLQILRRDVMAAPEKWGGLTVVAVVAIATLCLLVFIYGLSGSRGRVRRSKRSASPEPKATRQDSPTASSE